MTSTTDRVRGALNTGPATSRQLIEALGVSQPTISRALAALGGDIVRLGSGVSMRYSLRDRGRGLEDVSVWRVSAEGTLQKLGTLIAATPGPDALAFVQSDGVATWFDGLPWWLNDMRPQGYLGRAWAARHGRALGLPDDCRLWSGTHTLRALLAHGHDGTGNLLLGDYAREQFLSMPEPEPVVPAEFPALASAAAEGSGGSSAGGEQPKFVAYTGDPPRHSIIKFSATENDPVVRRWRNLLVAEHLALETLRDFRVPAAVTHVVDVKDQRFLVSERFDRRGTRGRVALLSLESLDAEFVGRGSGPWPVLASALAEGGHITRDALAQVQSLYAFGVLIGNTDMHLGNVSFLGEHEKTYAMAPAYDMLPAALAPGRSGAIPAGIPPPSLDACIPLAVWHQVRPMADCFLKRLRVDDRCDPEFRVLVDMVLSDRLAAVDSMLARLSS